MHRSDSPTVHDAPLRREDPALLRGQGHFAADATLPGTLHAVIVRADRATPARLRVHTATAAAMPGVVAVWCGNDVQAHLSALGGRPGMPPPNPLLELEQVPACPWLVVGPVHYPGQPVALVLASTLEQARTAAQRVSMDYDPSPAPEASPKTAPETAPEKSSTGDLVCRVQHAQGQLDASTEQSARVDVRALLQVPRLLAVALEPRAVLAHWNEGLLTLRMGTQSPARAQADVAAACALQPHQVRVVCGDVGGAFGAKSSVGPEELLLALAARVLGRPVRWVASRSEEFMTGMHGRGAQLQGRMVVDAHGALHLQAHLHYTLGAWLPFSAVVPLRNAARILPGPYRVASLHVQGQAKASPTAPVTIYRGAGRPEAALLMEVLLEQAARALGQDPLELRRQHLIAARDMPFTTPTGEVLDSGDYPATLERAQQAFGYAARRARQQQRRAAGEVVGIGTALYVEPCGSGWESARVRWEAEDRVWVASGSPAQGQGHASTWARIAAQALNLPESQVQVALGDTALCPPGIGALASRSTAIGGSAIVQACRQLLQRRAAGEALPLECETRFEARESWSCGCVMAQMRVDRETGQPTVEHLTWVDDAGNVVHPALAHGQLVGGLAQGLGQALMEALRFDAGGQLLTGSLMDYALPRAADMPPLQMESLHSPSPLNLLGAKGVGEAGCIGVPAALMNAARDALSPLGECALQFPLEAEQIWRQLQGLSPRHRPRMAPGL